MEQARVELGPEAMLMSSKKTGPESRRLGAYEVVFGIAFDTPPAVPGPRAALESAPARENPDAVVRELADLRKQIENVRRSVSRPTYSGARGPHWQPEFSTLYDTLSDAGFSEEIARELIENVASRIPGGTQETTRAALGEGRPIGIEVLYELVREEIEQRVRTAPELGISGAEQRVVAFVGPSGAGKTTSLVKLALKHGVVARIPLQILSTDTLRIGGSEQLGAYARILGVGFQTTPTLAALDVALTEARSKKLLLIDTPGYGAAEMEEASELKTFLKRNPQIEVQLVLPATLRVTTLTLILERFAIFAPSKVLFTHLDEAPEPGAVLDSAIRSQLPISFLATGQQIPDDLEEASIPLMTDKLFERGGAAASFAA